MTSLTKNTSYVSSLVDFFNDTKPFHSKLTDVIEEYHFFDDMSVRISEKTNTQLKLSSTWHYQYNSDGDKNRPASFRIKNIGSAYSTAYNEHVYTVGAHENTDFVNVPFVYSKSTHSASAPSIVKRINTNDYYQEGLDYFSAYGGLQFSIKQTTDAGSRFIPLWVEKRDEGLISTSQEYTRRAANDITNPTSSISILKSHLEDLKEMQGIPEFASTELTRLLGIISISDKPFIDLSAAAKTDNIDVPSELSGFALIKFIEPRLSSSTATTKALYKAALDALDKIILPRDYEALLISLKDAHITPPTWAPGGWIGDTKTTNYVSDVLSAITPPLYFRTFSDSQFIESGKSYYPSVLTQYLSISNIKVSSTAPAGGSWSIVAYDDELPIYTVFNNVTGYVGSFTTALGGTTFTSTDISFFAQYLGQAKIGETCYIRNTNRLVFGPSAPLETWDIIKTNPLAYSRPGFVSKRFGYITNLQGVFGKVSINLPNSSLLKTGTISLVCRQDAVSFDVISSVDPLYRGIAYVNKAFNDGKLGFYIRTGSEQAFLPGDKFVIEVKNELAFIQEHDIYYGYDLDSYDNSESVYQRDFVSVDKYDAAGFGVDPIEPVGDSKNSQKIGFLYDTRFTDYDVSKMNVAVSENSITNRKWRIVAVPNLRRPMLTLKKDLSTLSESIDLQEQTIGISPDPAKNAVPEFSMPGDMNTIPDLKAYYADEFRVEYSDNGFTTAGIFAGTVSVGGAYSNTVHGIAFSLPAGEKPFIAVLADDGYNLNGTLNPIVQGGDVVMFTVINKPPEILTDIISISSYKGPELIMHGEGFFEAPAASWTVAFTSSTNYTVSAKYTETQIGKTVVGTPISGRIDLSSATTREGTSFKSEHVHFTFIPPAKGFAAGDSFVFKTYAKKPTYLVHGSSSGWMPEATVGEAYWNGIIGFEIQKPKATLFDRSLADPAITQTIENTWTIGSGNIKLTRLRFDAPSLTYSLIPMPESSATSWIVHRSDKGPIGRLSNSGSFSEQYITISANVTLADIKKLQLQITGDDFDMWNNKNAVVVRPGINAFIPKIGEKLIIDKLKSDTVKVNMTYDFVQSAKIPNTNALALESIDDRLASLSTELGRTPIELTSPETAHKRNWIPISILPKDSNTSEAIFPNNGKTFEVYAIGTGEIVGTISPELLNEMWHTQFTWDPAFFAKYLPLSTFTNFVVHGSSGSNDNVDVKISETLKVMLEPGALTMDYTLTDEVKVKITEYIHETLVQKNIDRVPAVITDGPFGGFLPGYGNMSYDDESDPSMYDAGLPLLSHFHEARKLSGLDPMTPRQTSMSELERLDRLNLLLQLLNNFLVNNDLAATSLQAFTNNLNADTSRLLTTDKFGYAAHGLGIGVTVGRPGIDTSNPSTDGTAVGVSDAIVVISKDATQNGTLPTVAIFSVKPGDMVQPQISTFGNLNTSLSFSSSTSTSFIAEFNIAAPASYTKTMKTPQVYVWVSTWPAPIKATTVSKAGTGKYRVTVASGEEVKFYLVPGV